MTELVDQLLVLIGMAECNDKVTPPMQAPLGAGKDGPPRKEAHLWSYPAAIGMLQYLAQNAFPKISYAVNQCARFTHHPKLSHEVAVKHICRYLNAKCTQGCTFKPTNVLQMDCYVDTDFAGLWNAEDPEDPTFVKLRTGYIITLAGCPMMWGSKLQQMVALSLHGPLSLR